MTETWSLAIPGANPLAVERDDDGVWRCENPYGPTGPGLGRRILIRERGGRNWDVGWEGDVYASSTDTTDLRGALNFLVGPQGGEPDRPWMRALIDLVVEENWVVKMENAGYTVSVSPPGPKAVNMQPGGDFAPAPAEEPWRCVVRDPSGVTKAEASGDDRGAAISAARASFDPFSRLR